MRKLLATLLTICMVAALFGVAPVTATEYSAATEVVYGGYKLNAATPYLHASSNRNANQTLIASSNKTEEGRFLLAEFDAETGTLTYKDGYAIETRAGAAEGALGFNSKTNFALDSADGIKYGIKANGSLTIDVGDFNNSLFIAWNADIQNFNLRGIDVAGDLTVKGGAGMLQITGTAPLDTNKDDDAANEYTSYAINTLGDVNFLGGTVFIYNRPWTTDYQPDTAVFINAGGDIKISGAKLRLRAQKGDAYVQHFSKEPVVSGYYKIYDNENIEMHTSDSSLGFTKDAGAGYGNPNNKSYYPAAGPATEVLYGTHKLDSTNRYLITNKAKIGTSQRVSATDTVGENEIVLAEFDAENATLTYKNGYAPESRTNAVDNELSYNGSLDLVLTEDGTTKYGIKANGSLTIDMGEYHNAFYVNWNAGVENVNIRNIEVDGDLTIKGSTGSLKMAANAPYDTTPDDGDAAMMGCGLYATGDINLLGGTVYIFEHSYRAPKTGDSVVFINAGGDINYNGATVKLRGRKDISYFSHTNKAAKVAGFYEVDDNANLDMNGADGSMGFVKDNGAGYGNTNNKTYIPAGHFIEVGNNNVKLGGADARYLHWTTRDLSSRANNVYAANNIAEGASAVYDPETRTLKILEDNFQLVDYYENTSGAAIESDGALTIDTNGNNLYVISFYNGCGDTICAKGELKLTGTGSILAGNAGTSLASGANAAVLRSDSKIIIDTKANLHTANDKVGASEPRGYVLNAPAVEFTEKAVAKLGTGLAHWDENWDKTSFYPGRIFHANVTDIKIPGEADATVCTDMHADLFKGFGAETETAKTYSPDTFALATYLSVSTVDTTVSIDDISVYGGNVKIKLSKGSGLSADAENPEVVVVAAAYDENGMVINAKELRAAADGTVNTIEIGATENVKVYIWSAEDGITPLKKIKIY